MTSMQCSLIDPEDSNNISLVEEEQETFELAVESADVNAEPIHFHAYSIHLKENFERVLFCSHPEKQYPVITRTVPFSPPEFS